MILNLKAQVFNSVTQPIFNNKIELAKPIEVPIDTVINTSIISKKIMSNVKIDSVDVFKFFKTARLPLNRIYLTSGFGYRTHPVTGERNKFHSGIDLNARTDTVYSILHGVVKETGYNSIIGNFIRITHGNYTSIYGHLSYRFVKPGDLVASGTPVGISGATGRVTGEHLHFSIKYKDQFLNPLPFLYQMMNLDTQSLYYSLKN
ncbi:M23 family metallopeptidase [Pedobacter polaris]|uniref:M23 family metallopeptidase n=1 Tax=Pedobacter polaris TaxID=2571273 RepID=UPI00145C9F9E|nr:M23 family metallopeptidase [Pedobacter polaris]